MKKELYDTYNSRQRMLRDNFEVYHYLNKSMTHVKIHHHDFYEIFYLVQGSVRYFIEGEIYDIVPGDVLLINTTELHKVSINPTKGDYERIVLWLDKQYVDSISTEATKLSCLFECTDKKKVVKLNLLQNSKVFRLLKDLIGVNSSGRSVKDVLSNAYIIEILALLTEATSEESYELKAKRNHLIDQVIDYINNNYDEILTMDSISEKFFVSKFHLSREFKEYTGVSPYQFIKMKRLIKAKELILDHKNITSICLEVGFGDYSNFFRAFKKEYGLTPKEYYNQCYK